MTLLRSLAAFTAALSFTTPAHANLIVHEWGTFTSIAGRDGVSLDWRPLAEKSDLPAFVYELHEMDGGLRAPEYLGKGQIRGTIRMETPVIYFYADQETDVSVRVGFPLGQVTEWYPRARALQGGIDWGRIKVLARGAPEKFLTEPGESHYYPARETDASPVRVCTTDRGAETEKFLFYRGVGNFQLPLNARLEGNNIVLENLPSRAIVFENKSGRIGYSIVEPSKKPVELARPPSGVELERVLEALHAELVAQGLYEKEAAAMIATWRSSWFEEGLRVFYMLPPAATETILPLQLEPKPAELVRVLVGRTELITPEKKERVEKHAAALTSPDLQTREAALRALEAEGRFAEPILTELLANAPAAQKKALEAFIQRPL